MSDYDREPKTGSSQFLRLKSKDDSVIVRVASAPWREPKVWKAGEQKPMADENAAALKEAQWAAIMGNPDFNVTEVFSWKVIDRSDGKAKIFSSTPGVYKKFKAYATMDAWGDPKNYDIQITRTEDPGPGYYDVMALPDKSELTDAELEAVENLQQMNTLLPNARPSSSPQIDDLSDEFTKPAKSRVGAEKKAEEKPEEPDIVIDDIDDDPINLDDIPF